MKHANIRTVVLITTTFAYLFFGAAIFDHLESKNEIEETKYLLEAETIFKLKYNISDEDYNIITYNIIRSKPYKSGIQWKFTGALYFSTTVLTTIGYGHSTPRTDKGKIFCMFYAIAGIPLGLIMFQSIGERFNKFIMYCIRSIHNGISRLCSDKVKVYKEKFEPEPSKKIFKSILKIKYKKSKNVQNSLVKINKSSTLNSTIMIFVSITLCVVLVSLGAMTFSHFEDWSYMDSCYYCLITLTTIGFGDFVALQKNKMMQTSPGYYVFSLVFILFGLTVVSAAMNLLVLRFITTSSDVEKMRSISNTHHQSSKSIFQNDVFQRIFKKKTNSSTCHSLIDLVTVHNRLEMHLSKKNQLLNVDCQYSDYLNYSPTYESQSMLDLKPPFKMSTISNIFHNIDMFNNNFSETQEPYSNKIEHYLKRHTKSKKIKYWKHKNNISKRRKPIYKKIDRKNISLL
ncbi:Potassium channel subfamily K member 9 [Intoshia linei]|uniref:Potassium channel subfamily K member 9 n=1 Tax=Intoshia linei TaxID=1819745 RepID=A0A177B8F3_9BILA|nr:Potassium channel subfamily K member 9 [Intoshia linei]